MGAERDISHDVHARATSTPGTSIGALSAYLKNACGHVWLDERAFDLGYRFHAALNDEIPSFFNRRAQVGGSTIAVTLQSGLSLDGEDRFEDCTSTRDALEVVQDERYQTSLWTTLITINGQVHELDTVASAEFIARRPAEFRHIAEELVALGAVQGATCPFCSSQ